MALLHISGMMHHPSYRSLFESGGIESRAGEAEALLASCTVCPRNCRVDRTAGELGYCRGGLLPRVASFSPHFGEEPPLVGRHGSGTIFFSGCNLRCRFCQNYGISHGLHGGEISCGTLAGMMLSLQESGCHNINLVSPSHFVPQIVRATAIAAGKGLDIPLVYNTGTYDSVPTLRLLDGIVDIYMPDAKYGSDAIARILSDAPRYTTVMQDAILEMQRQVGDLVMVDGIAARGLIIRHLVLPGGLAGTDEVMRFIGDRVSKNAYVNIMDQYRPNGRLPGDRSREDPVPECLLRRITTDEYEHAARCARKYGLRRGFL